MLLGDCSDRYRGRGVPHCQFVLRSRPRYEQSCHSELVDVLGMNTKAVGDGGVSLRAFPSDAFR